MEPQVTWKLKEGSGQVAPCLEPSSGMVVTDYRLRLLERRNQACCCCCWMVMTMNSAGWETATPTLTFMMPFKMSSGVMVTPSPTATEKAWAAVGPTRAPWAQRLVRKLLSMLATRDQVLASFGSNT